VVGGGGPGYAQGNDAGELLAYLEWVGAPRRGGETMASRQTNLRARDRELDGEIERYREAAQAALGQLEWTVGYLDRIHKRQIARALDRNRRQIAEIMRSPTER
jgi:hypothetical protein